MLELNEQRQATLRVLEAFLNSKQEPGALNQEAVEELVASLSALSSLSDTPDEKGAADSVLEQVFRYEQTDDLPDRDADLLERRLHGLHALLKRLLVLPEEARDVVPPASVEPRSDDAPTARSGDRSGPKPGR